MKTLSHPTITISLLNLSIVAACVAIGVATDNPLTLLGLLMLRDVPIFERSEEIEEEEPSSKIGFNADL